MESLSCICRSAIVEVKLNAYYRKHQQRRKRAPLVCIEFTLPFNELSGLVGSGDKEAKRKKKRLISPRPIIGTAALRDFTFCTAWNFVAALVISVYITIRLHFNVALPVNPASCILIFCNARTKTISALSSYSQTAQAHDPVNAYLKFPVAISFDTSTV